MQIADETVQLSRAAVLDLTRDDGFLEFRREQCVEVGDAFRTQYVSATPFPHIVLNDFIDRTIMRRVLDEFPGRQKGRFADSHSQLKTGYTLGMIRSAYIQDLFAALNSAAFIAFLQHLTGIKGLVADQHFTGGGLHETARGGHLSVHADFNIHPHTKLQRRLNLILFLNEDWDCAWGGSLELWDNKMVACRKSVAPVMGRAIIFNTDSTSYHGHPEPLDCPPDILRRSIALYYYTLPSAAAALRPHTTLFQARPNSGDVKPSLRTRLDPLRRLLRSKLDMD